MCVLLAAAISLPKLLNVQNLRLTSSLVVLQHTCVCSQQQLVGQAAVDLLQHMCVVAHSSNGLKRFEMVKTLMDLFCTRHVCFQKHTCAFPQQYTDSYSS